MTSPAPTKTHTHRVPATPGPSYRGFATPAIVLLLLLVLGGAGTAGRAQGSELTDPDSLGLTGSERLAALITRADDARQRNDPLWARFEQTEEGPLQLEPEISRGTLVLAQPNRARWDFDTPEAITLLVTDTALTTWFRDRDRVERRVLGERGSRMVAMMAGGGSLAELEKRFRIRATFPGVDDSDAPYRLDLEPRSRRLARRLAGLSLTLDRRRFVPLEVTIRGADGTVTTLRLSDVEAQVELGPDVFEPAWGPEVEVVDLTDGESGTGRLSTGPGGAP